MTGTDNSSRLLARALSQPMSRASALRLMGSGAGAAVLAALTGCVDQHPEDRAAGSVQARIKAGKARLVATSPATVEICNRLDLDLVGVSSSSLTPLHDRYKDVEQVGTAMSPDIEKLKKLKPDYVLSPNSLQSDLQPKYAGAQLASIFLNLRSVEGMFTSIEQLGEKFDRKQQARELDEEHKQVLADFKKKVDGRDAPTCLVLMGLPGSYLVATEKSYVGDLVALAGGKNVYQSDSKDFLNVNTEDMKDKEPDVILRAAHALPDEVTAMFDKEFRENDIWSHFDAVKNNRVFDLPYEDFGMSATFNYAQGLEALVPMLYPDA